MDSDQETWQVWDQAAYEADGLYRRMGEPKYVIHWTGEWDEHGAAVARATTELDGAPGWSIDTTLVLERGEIRRREVRIFSTSGVGMPLHDELSARLHLGDFTKQVAREVKRPATLFLLPGEWTTAPVKVAKRPGRRGHGELFYARWAQRYVDALEDEEREGSVYEYLAAKYDEPRARTIALWITKARNEHGFLTKTKRGVEGGELTEAAKQELDGEREA